MADKSYILAVDQGSSGTMVAALDTRLGLKGAVDTPISVSAPRYGWAEHDPDELTRSITDGARQLLARYPELAGKLAGVGIANQGESFLLWDADTHRPLTPVISWQDGRAEQYCDALQRQGRDAWFHQKTGLHLSPEWPALKLRLVLEAQPDLAARCRAGKVVYGQLDAWFACSLSGGQALVTDHSTAARSGLYNLHTMDWDPELLAFFGGTDLILPTLVDNTCHVPGMDLGIGETLPLVASGLDQSVALIGQGCVEPYSAKVTYGTCCACWVNTGGEYVPSEELTSSIAWKAGPRPVYALAAEGGAAGNIVTWLKNNFHMPWSMAELSDIAAQNDDQPGLLFIPAFNGLFAPHWAPQAKATLLGMTVGTGPAHILRAGFDAIACTVRDMLDSLPGVQTLIVDGGMTANDYLMQKQADILGREICKTGVQEGTLMGIGALALHSLGIIDSLAALPPGGEQRITPRADGEAEYRRWQRAVKFAVSYYES